MNITLSGNSRLINLGEWINACTYAEFDGENLSLKSFVSEDVNIIRN
jgi:UDP-2,3-diacylglucosamine hydrolase